MEGPWRSDIAGASTERGILQARGPQYGNLLAFNLGDWQGAISALKELFFLCSYYILPFSYASLGLQISGYSPPQLGFAFIKYGTILLLIEYMEWGTDIWTGIRMKSCCVAHSSPQSGCPEENSVRWCGSLVYFIPWFPGFVYSSVLLKTWFLLNIHVSKYALIKKRKRISS